LDGSDLGLGALFFIGANQGAFDTQLLGQIVLRQAVFLAEMPKEM